MCRCAGWSWSRPKLESGRNAMCGSAALRRNAASSLLPGAAECQQNAGRQGEKQMKNHQSRRDFCATAIATVFASTTFARAGEKKYGPGASDTEIKLGQTVP